MPALSERTREVRQLIAKGDRATSNAEQHYKAAGAKLAALKAPDPNNDGKPAFKSTRTRAPWAQFVKQYIGISKSRADELIRLAGGEITLEEVQTRVRQTMRRTRERRGNGNGRHVSADAQTSSACNADPYDPADVGEPGDDPATVQTEIVVNRLKQIAHQALEALANAKQADLVHPELAEWTTEAMQATTNLLNYLQGRISNAQAAEAYRSHVH
jgi:hypothetical protein